MARPTVIDEKPNKHFYYPFVVITNTYGRRCNTIDGS